MVRIYLRGRFFFSEHKIASLVSVTDCKSKQVFVETSNCSTHIIERTSPLAKANGKKHKVLRARSPERKTMYTYSHTNTSPASSNVESSLLNDLIAKWQKERLEEIQGKLLAASSDLHISYDLMNSALELIKDLPDEQRLVDSEDISSVEAAKEQALKYWKNFEAISDFSDSPKEIVNSLRSLFQKEEFPSDCWGILMGTEIAASIFRKSGICQITKHDEETGDKYEIYGEDNFTLKSTFSNLLDFFWYLGRRFRILEGAGPVCFDLERLQNIREGLLSALNDMMAAEPEDFPMNEREYFKCVEAIQAAMQAERMLEEQAKNAFVSADSMKKWKNYCRSYEGEESKIAILNALRLCPLDIILY